MATKTKIPSGGTTIWRSRLAALVCFLAAATAALLFGGDAGVALKPAEIKAAPYLDAKTIGSLARDDRVEIVGREGGWYRIASGTGDGWVRMLSVRRGEPRKLAASAEELFGLATGRAGSGRVVATTGIRGLDEEQLKQAKYNASEIKKLNAFTVTSAQAKKFADEGKLAARRVNYLAESE